MLAERKLLILDGLADLMIASFEEVEHNLSLSAQPAPAVGIHYIVAT